MPAPLSIIIPAEKGFCQAAKRTDHTDICAETAAKSLLALPW
jgi:hypothetical protein